MRKLVLVLAMFIPSFFCTGQAFVYNGATNTRAENLAAMTIAGIVNRDSARLYLQNVFEPWCYNLTDEKWKLAFINEGVTFTPINTIQELIQIFDSRLKGAVLYSDQAYYSNFPGQSFLWQGEFAAMLGGLSDCVPIPVGKEAAWGYYASDSIVLLSYSGSDSLKMPSDLTLAMWPWNNAASEDQYLDMLDWGYVNILPLCNPTCFFLREITDWPISQKMFQLDLAGNEPNSLNFYSLSERKAQLIENLLNYFHNLNPGALFDIYGWMEPEPLVQWLSAKGATFHESMQANLSWFHAFQVPDTLPERASLVNPEDLVLQRKYYILFIGSEGDAGSWNVGFQGGAWNSPKRGEVPVGWGFNLHFFEKFPYLAYYYNKNATANDGFISMISPLGYTYSDVLPPSTLDSAIQIANARHEKFRMQVAYAYKHYNGQGSSLYRGVEISNYYDTAKMNYFYRNAGFETTFLFEPKLFTQTAYDNGIVLFNHINDNTFYGDISNLTAKKAEIVDRLKRKEPPYFYLAGYQRMVGEYFPYPSDENLSMTNLVELKQLLEADPDVGERVEFVTPERFNLLLMGYMGKIDIEYDSTAYGISEKPDPSAFYSSVHFTFKPSEKELIVNIENEEAFNTAVTFCDLYGRNIMLYPTQQSGHNRNTTFTYNLSHLAPALYIATATSSLGIKSYKVLILN